MIPPEMLKMVLGEVLTNPDTREQFITQATEYIEKEGVTKIVILRREKPSLDLENPRMIAAHLAAYIVQRFEIPVKYQ